MQELSRRFDGYEELKPLLDTSDREVLDRLQKPALIRIPGTDPAPRSRLVSCLLHGNEDSGYRAVLQMLRAAERWPFDLWVFIGNVRAARTDGWFGHRYLDDQEDFNRVWGLREPTTRMRRCADAVLDEILATDVEAAIDLHNNTGSNPYYTVLPRLTPESLNLATTITVNVLAWDIRQHTLMEALSPYCPAGAVECGLAGHPENAGFAFAALRRFLAAADFGTDEGRPHVIYDRMRKVVVRPEVPFRFGGHLDEDVDLVVNPGLDARNFGMLLADTEIGRISEGAAMPLRVTDGTGRDVTADYLVIRGNRVVVTRDLMPVMMTTNALQARRDCLFYIARRRG